MAFDPNHDDVTLTKPLDELVPGLYMYCPATGNYHAWAVLFDVPYCGGCGQEDKNGLIARRAAEEAKA
jgi:hypothetical protein